MAAWADLRIAAERALASWRAAQAAHYIDEPFWMVGEVFGHGTERNSYHDSGFDALINFEFQTSVQGIFRSFDAENDYTRILCMHRIDRLYARWLACVGYSSTSPAPSLASQFC